MTVASISVDLSGKVSYIFEVCDLFWDHAIMLDGDLASGPARVDLIG